ncbi:hypothetical protein [Psychroflexus aestuariivivens]|uniref:hypothetical protein n=1 Tax=Psychroflexus aestuariivivens TaxID=1795040 RepID=UPI000FDBBE2C|nr:hypothetical protein [Psychroflexus aestuariivivens]
MPIIAVTFHLRILFWFFILLPALSFSQDTYKFNFQKEFENDEIELLFYQGKDKQTLKTKNSKVKIPQSLIQKSDSIIAKFSFYKTKLEKAEFNNKTINLNTNIGLEEVLISNNKKFYVGPDESKSELLLLGKNMSKCIDLEVSQLPNNIKLVGIRFKFKRGNKLLWGYRSRGKRFKVILLGYHIDKRHKKLTSLLDKDIVIKIPNKVPEWVEIDLSEKQISHEVYNYLVFGIETIDGGIGIKTYERTKEEIKENPMTHFDMRNPIGKSYNTKREKFYKVKLPNFQLIFEVLEEE